MNKLIAEIKQLPLKVWAAVFVLLATVITLLIFMPVFTSWVLLVASVLAAVIWALGTIMIYVDGR